MKNSIIYGKRIPAGVKTVALAAILLSAPAAYAQVTLTPIERSGAASGPDTGASGLSAAAGAASKVGCVTKKKKKGLGLGGLLKTVKDSGLGNMVAGGALGRDSAIAGTVAGGVIDAGAALESATGGQGSSGC